MFFSFFFILKVIDGAPIFRRLVLFQVLDRGEKIELLVDKTENLQFQVMILF